MRRNGFALAMVLWISAILMASTIYLISMYKKSVDNAKSLHNKLIAELQADSTIEKLKFYALTGKFERNYIENSFSNFPKKLPITNQPIDIDKNTTLKLQGDGAMLSMYSTNSKLLNNLIQSYTAKDINYQDVYLDWIDTDSVTLLNGAEDGFYNVSASYSCSNIGAIQHPEELFLIKYFNQIEATVQEKILKNFHYALYSYINPNIITPDYAQKIIKLEEFDASQLKTLYTNDAQKYKEYLYLLLQKYGFSEINIGSSLTLFGEVTIDYQGALVKREFNIMFKPAYNYPYTTYRNLLSP